MFVDFKAAFDSIDRKALYYKLYNYRIYKNNQRFVQKHQYVGMS